MGLIRWIKNLQGFLKGIGWCRICGDNWIWKPKHTIFYSDSSGAFAYCEECHRKQPIKRKIQAINDLVSSWIESNPYLQEQFERIQKEIIRRVCCERRDYKDKKNTEIKGFICRDLIVEKGEHTHVQVVLTSTGYVRGLRVTLDENTLDCIRDYNVTYNLNLVI